MALGAYFSSQGIPFPQAVGGVQSLVAYKSGSLGGDILYQGRGVILETDTPDSTSTDVMSEDEAYVARLNSGPANSWHDGIFAAQDGGNVGTNQAYNSGSLGLPLYINGREITRPMTIRHGSVSGFGCAGCGTLGADPASTPAVVDPVAPSAVTPAVVPVAPAPSGSSAQNLGLDPFATIVDLGNADALFDLRAMMLWMASKVAPSLTSTVLTGPSWGTNDGVLALQLDTLLGAQAARSTLSGGIITGPDWLVGSKMFPTPAWIMLASVVATGAGGTAVGNAWPTDSFKTPFFKKTVPQFLAAYTQGKVDWSKSQLPIDMLKQLMVSAPDGTVIQGGKVTISGTSVTPGTPGYVAPLGTAAKGMSMAMMGGLALLAVGAVWIFWPKKR